MMTIEIERVLEDISSKYNVKILLACESGSRAWGFPSIDSDYDVRFIYSHTKDVYLSIDKPQENLDFPISGILDVNGWELAKALRLFRNSNAPLFEWLQSPIIYAQDEQFKKLIAPLLTDSFSLRAGIHHYSSMTRNALPDLSDEKVRIKKYFYAIRSILAASWIARKNELPPMELGKLRSLIDNTELQDELDRLLIEKSMSTEKDTIPQQIQINQFIEQELAYCESIAASLPNVKADSQVLNNIFRYMVNEF